MVGTYIYDDYLPYKSESFTLPKQVSKCKMKIDASSDIKEAPVYRNGFIHHDTDSSGSQIVHINSAMYIVKPEKPLLNGWGDEKCHKMENPPPSISKNCMYHSRIHPDSVGKEIFSPTDGSLCPKSSGITEIANRTTKYNEDCTRLLCKRNNADAETSPSGSYCSSSGAGNCGLSSSDDGYSSAQKRIAHYPEQPSPGNFIPAKEITYTGNTVTRMFQRSYSNIERGEDMCATYVSKNSNNSAFTATKKRVTKLTDIRNLETFPEKHIHRKIQTRNDENDDADNPENLLAVEDSAWFRWYTSKLEQERQKKEAKRNEEARKKAEEEKNKGRELRQQEAKERALRIWKEKKDKEEKEKRRKQLKELELEKKKKESDQTQIEKLAKKTRTLWSKKKDQTHKERQIKEEMVQMQKEEERKQRELKNQKAFEEWKREAKNKPKPMSVAIRDNKGRPDPAIARLNWNPIPWQNIIEEPDNVETRQGEKNLPSQTVLNHLKQRRRLMN